MIDDDRIFFYIKKLFFFLNLCGPSCSSARNWNKKSYVKYKEF